MTAVAPLLHRALAAASDTRFLAMGSGVLATVAELFGQAFGDQREAVIIADTHTYPVAGDQVVTRLEAAGIACRRYVIDEPTLIADWAHVEELEALFRQGSATPVAVGAGVLNDLVKLAAHRAGRQYLCVATAASMDGYTAYAASITRNGSKQTFDCPAPIAVLADLDVIASAPAYLNAAGYADLVAKIPAGADWIVADALGVEPIDATAWDLVQPHLPEWSADPAGIAAGKAEAVEGLVEGLMMTGFAMQGHQSSRPASGAEHQFSHVWDMQHHTHNGEPVPHGFKVGLGALATTRLYEWLFRQDLGGLDIDAACARWPADVDAAAAAARAAFDIEDMGRKAELEMRAKYLAPDRLREQLVSVRQQWPELRTRLERQLIPSSQLRQDFERAGVPVTPEQISLSEQRLRQTHWQAYFIRRRFTVLDLAVRTGLLARALDELYATN